MHKIIPFNYRLKPLKKKKITINFVLSFHSQHLHLFRTYFLLLVLLQAVGEKQATRPSKRPQFWGLGKRQNLGKRMLSKKMAQRKKASFSPQQDQTREEERPEWRSSLNSIMEGFKSLPKDEGNLTGETADKGKDRFDQTWVHLKPKCRSYWKKRNVFDSFIPRQQLDCWGSRGKKLQLLLVCTAQQQATHNCCQNDRKCEPICTRSAAIELKLGRGENGHGSAEGLQGLLPLITILAMSSCLNMLVHSV